MDPSDTPSRQTLRRRLHLLLDIATSLAVIVGMATLVWLALQRRQPTRPFGVAAALPVDSIETVHDGQSQGLLNASTGIVAYMDFECPYCSTFARTIWPTINAQFVKTGKTLFVFKHRTLDSIHPLARRAAHAAECAASQGQFWSLHDVLFAKPLTPASLQQALRTPSLISQAGIACLSGPEPTGVAAGNAAAERRGIESTPTLLVGRLEPQGIAVAHVMQGSPPLDRLTKVLNDLLVPASAAAATRSRPEAPRAEKRP